MFDNIKENKLKALVYISFIFTWLGAQFYKGVYATYIIYQDKEPYLTYVERNWALIFCVLVMFSFLALISYKGFKTVLIVTSFILSCWLLGDIAYGRYYYTPLSVALIDQIALLGSLGESTASLIYKKDLILFLDFFLLCVMSLYLRKYNFKIGYKFRALFSLIFLMTFSSMAFTVYKLTFNEQYIYNRKLVGDDLGVYLFHYEDVRSYLGGKLNKYKNPTDEELQKIEMANQANDHINEYTGLLEGKNVIMLQLEAFQNFVIGKEFGGIEVTPNLNRLIRNNSIYASNYYYETAGGNTADAELLTNTSMLPTYQGSAFYLYPYNTYISLPLLFKEEGYSVNSFHVYENTFWNRQIMHKTLGYDKFYSINDFEFTEDEKVGWTLSDELFFKMSLDKTIEAAGDNNFYSYMIALSSHYPYEAFYNGPYTGMLGRSGEVPIFERYLNATHYVDYAVGEFFKYLNEKGLYEDTVVVIYGDHGGLFSDERIDMVNALGLQPTEQQYAKLETVPFIIHNPSIEQSVIVDKVVGQKDAMPTIANLMNLDVPYTLGNDILDENYEGVVIKRYGNVYTNDFIFLQNENKFYDYETLEEIEDTLTEPYKEIVNNTHSIIQANDLIYKYDYLRKYQRSE